MLVNSGGTWVPAVDLYETPERFVLYVDLPGIAKENIDIGIHERLVVISGLRRDPEKGCAAERLEIRTGRFEREIELPESIDMTGVEALLKDGVLRLTLPRTRGSRIAVAIDKPDGDS